MYSQYKKGSIAARVYSDGETNLQALDTAMRDVTFEYACDEIETLEELLEQEQAEVKRLKEKAVNAGSEEFLRVMKNIRTYVNDYIDKLEPKNREDKQTPADG